MSATAAYRVSREASAAVWAKNRLTREISRPLEPPELMGRGFPVAIRPGVPA
jgi:hypothetical protein